MSKITPKNLSYDTTLPPFLARLQATNASSDGRHEYAVARPKKVRSAEDEADDEPVYFNEESGETLTKSEWEEKEKEKEKEKELDISGIGEGEGDADATDGIGKEKAKEERVAAIGGSRKRKVGKVIGGEEEVDEGVVYERAKEHIKKTGKVSGTTDGKKGDLKAEVGPKKPAAAKKKVGKKIKLSFGDEE
ncbi:hypothetical protein HYFRA_00009301 [Hymenoscyphus fraxineus]|uniref:DUF4604 domain-containing protein n=1 Tax=Hymenoscyphus fraxineus TaxID=746836 RepID=A0A9N9KZ31_9HELO|nr:hypothetical protein HYFRA_00009301 [Hymenoscyphus fraxineus]